jgi:hypothetical protein
LIIPRCSCINNRYFDSQQPAPQWVNAYNKSAFVAAVQTSEDGKPLFIQLTPIKAFTKQAFVAGAKMSLAPNAHVVSDGL